VLDGGFDRWKTDGRPVTAQPTKIAPGIFHADFDARRVASLADMRRIVGSSESQIADARGPGRFAGSEPEPRAGVRSGHMPGARNVPASALSENGAFLSKDRLRRVIADAGIDLSKPVVTSCGSGITAAVITLALETVGHTDNQLYDGSWTEWGGLSDTPVVVDKP
jgi:thiosulfate/3-mercaptopyruvate sulfurtransferase